MLISGASIDRTFEHTALTEQTHPTTPFSVITISFFEIPELLPLSIIKLLNESIEFIPITAAGTNFKLSYQNI